jgi:signal transduction histidine kinase
VRFARTGRERSVGPESALALFRVLQESLTNVAKHCGRGTPVEVTLAFEPGSAALRVQDRGPGFLLPTDGGELSTQGHFGLENMRERAAKVGGTLDLSSGPGRGTRVELIVHAGEEQGR